MLAEFDMWVDVECVDVEVIIHNESLGGVVLWTSVLFVV